jgi:CheY-like chemotaxis protein
MTHRHALLAGCVVLVVEDEPLVGLDIAQALTSCGAQVVLTRTAADAMVSVDQTSPSAAVLDINLGSHDCSAVCQYLRARDIPFLFLTGYSNTLEGWSDIPLLSKPATAPQIIDAIVNLLKA